jgi:hypothetical protein
MRRRITRAFLAAAAAGATVTTLGFTAAGSAGAAVHGGTTNAPSAPAVATNATCTSTAVATTLPLGIPSDGCGMAGYEASGRNFRYAQALITVPNSTGNPVTDPQEYVALDNSVSNNWNFVRAGVSPCVAVADGFAPVCPAGNTSGWVAYVMAMRDSVPTILLTHSIATAALGDGVFASVYREPSGNVVDTRLVVPTAGGSLTFTDAVTFLGGTFPEAEALDDWSLAHAEGAGTKPALGLVKTRQTQFFQGAFTTEAGNRGTFSGPWTLAAPEATSNGNLPPLGTLIAEPSFLWNDGMGNGWGDAFGVWIGPF